MRKQLIVLLALSSLVLGNALKEVKLKSITPANLIQELHLRELPSEGYAFQINDQQVRILINEATNKVMIMGAEEVVADVADLISFLDVPARQVSIEVQIIDVNKQKVSDLGIDWQEFLRSLNFGVALDFRASGSSVDYTDPDRYDQSNSSANLSANFDALRFPLGEMINVLVNSGAASISSSPRIVTINNREGSIVDGSHTTFVSKYSSYGDVYETQELYTGLSLVVTPSIGDDTYLSLDIEAKYTEIAGTISGNPVEKGQILNNHVIVKDKESFLLGAFKRRASQEGKNKIPLIGTILPFLFSNKTEAENEQDFLIVVTPTIIDLKGSSFNKK